MSATQISIQSGNSQAQGVADLLQLPLVVFVGDATNLPVSGVTVNFAITAVPVGASGQSLSAASAVSAGDGTARVFLTLGNQAGTYQIQASSGALTNSPLTFNEVGGAICTLSDAKQYLNQTTTTNDATILSWVGKISELIEGYLRQPVAPRPVIDLLNGSGESRIFLRTGRDRSDPSRPYVRTIDRQCGIQDIGP